MKKVLALVLALVLVLSLAGCGEPLVMNQEVFYSSPDGNGASFGYFVDCESSGISENNVSATSSDESIAVIEDGRVRVLGSKLGEADITFKSGIRTGNCHISVLDYPEHLEALAKQSEEKSEEKRSSFDQLYIDEYKIFRGIIKDIETFKDPSSIQIADDEYLYNNAHDSFIIRLRAKNSFGGYATSYFSVNTRGVTQIGDDWGTYGSYKYNGEPYYRDIVSKLPKALSTYISKNY